MITIYTHFLGAISSTQISNFLLIFFKGELYGIFLWEPFRGRLVSVFELIKFFLWKHVFLPNVTTPTCFFSKFHKNEKSLQPNVHCTVVCWGKFNICTFDSREQIQYTSDISHACNSQNRKIPQTTCLLWWRIWGSSVTAVAFPDLRDSAELHSSPIYVHIFFSNVLSSFIQCHIHHLKLCYF